MLIINLPRDTQKGWNAAVDIDDGCVFLLGRKVEGCNYISLIWWLCKCKRVGAVSCLSSGRKKEKKRIEICKCKFVWKEEIESCMKKPYIYNLFPFHFNKYFLWTVSLRIQRCHEDQSDLDHSLKDGCWSRQHLITNLMENNTCVFFVFILGSKHTSINISRLLRATATAKRKYIPDTIWFFPSHLFRSVEKKKKTFKNYSLRPSNSKMSPAHSRLLGWKEDFNSISLFECTGRFMPNINEHQTRAFLQRKQLTIHR